MVLIGNAITENDIVADPRYKVKPGEVTTKLLSKYTLEQMVKDDLEATKLVNSFKEEYGTGVSSLIRIYNASGHAIKFREQGPNWSGHMWKYPFDGIIQNGQWSVLLHVKTAWAFRGSSSSFIYEIEDEKCDVFCGWSTPNDILQYNQLYSNQVYTEVNASGYWPAKKSWDDMYDLVCKGSKHCTSTWETKTEDCTLTVKCSVQTGDNTSPTINFIISTS